MVSIIIRGFTLIAVTGMVTYGIYVQRTAGHGLISDLVCAITIIGAIIFIGLVDYFDL